jgi:hypothetical protein
MAWQILSAIEHELSISWYFRWELPFQRRPVGAAGGKGGATYLPAATPAGMGAAGTLASGGRPADMTRPYMYGRAWQGGSANQQTRWYYMHGQ